MFGYPSGVINPLSVYICVMTPEKRLNQLEPIMAEVSAQVDRVTAQNRQLITTVTQQSDDIQFLLRETSVIKQDVQFLLRETSVIKQDVSETKVDVSEMKVDISELKKGQSRLEQDVSGLNQKIDLILQLLKSGNGKS